jgi:hypothetical protein
MTKMAQPGKKYMGNNEILADLFYAGMLSNAWRDCEVDISDHERAGDEDQVV